MSPVKMWCGVVLLAGSLIISIGACHERKVKLELPPPKTNDTQPEPTPTVILTVSPATIHAGESTTLTWEAKHASSLVIDGGVGDVGLNGSRALSPETSTAYTATATGPGGSASATSRVTVLGESLPRGDRPDNPSVEMEKLFDENVKDVFFEYDKFELSPEAVDILYANASFLRRQPSIHIVLEGHCDARGTAAYNLALGDRRSKMVKDFLVGIGIAWERISTISYGEERPFATGENEDAWFKNRRVHFVLGRP